MLTLPRTSGLQGSISDKNGIYYAIFRNHWLWGGPSEADAQAVLVRANAAWLEGRYNRDDFRRRSHGRTQPGPSLPSHDEPAPFTIADIAAEWLTGKATTVRDSTARRYAQIVRHICRALGSVDARATPVTTVEGYRNGMRTELSQHGRPFAPKTIKEHVVILRAIFARARYSHKVMDPFVVLPRASANRDPMMPRVPRKPVRWLTADQIHRVYQLVLGTYLEAPTRIAFDCGVRLGEALGLVWDDVNFRVPQVTVRWQQGRAGGDREETKTLKTRSIPLTPSNARALLRLRQQHEALCGQRSHGRCRVFVGTPHHAKDDVNAASTAFARLMRRNGLDGTFHTARHTFANRQILSGMNGRTVAYWMGHSDPGFTLKVYTEFFEEAAGLEQAQTKRPLDFESP